MSTHRVPVGELDVALLQIVRGDRAHIDAVYLDDAEHWIIVTEDRIETRPTHATRLGIGGAA